MEKVVLVKQLLAIFYPRNKLLYIYYINFDFSQNK
jgi:hypothetical protein